MDKLFEPNLINVLRYLPARRDYVKLIGLVNNLGIYKGLLATMAHDVAYGPFTSFLIQYWDMLDADVQQYTLQQRGRAVTALVHHLIMRSAACDDVETLNKLRRAGYKLCSYPMLVRAATINSAISVLNDMEWYNEMLPTLSTNTVDMARDLIQGVMGTADHLEYLARRTYLKLYRRSRGVCKWYFEYNCKYAEYVNGDDGEFIQFVGSIYGDDLHARHLIKRYLNMCDMFYNYDLHARMVRCGNLDFLYEYFTDTRFHEQFVTHIVEIIYSQFLSDSDAVDELTKNTYVFYRLYQYCPERMYKYIRNNITAFRHKKLSFVLHDLLSREQVYSLYVRFKDSPCFDSRTLKIFRDIIGDRKLSQRAHLGRRIHPARQVGPAQRAATRVDHCK